MDNKILVTRSSMPSLDEYVEEIRPIWESHWLTNMGAKHKQLQAELEGCLGVPHVALYERSPGSGKCHCCPEPAGGW